MDPFWNIRHPDVLCAGYSAPWSHPPFAFVESTGSLVAAVWHSHPPDEACAERPKAASLDQGLRQLKDA